ncbi:uncharacterized protein LOC110690570 [Chenopodium quinoa]|uniref:uncharacterized protein LOC110690570 n=1 Tax=Chenopodium quinoa TaxID=63459 RepID=UPI000B77D95D|nr:uncharacterized protein LOC110690570 [Chenopodium quinoa]
MAGVPASGADQSPPQSTVVRQPTMMLDSGSTSSRNLLGDARPSRLVEQELDGDNVFINPEYLRGSSSDTLGRGHREKRPPSWHRNYVTHSLERSGTWTVEDLPPGKKAISSGWVYKIKYTDKSKVERLKARLVVHGNRQVEGVDYNETFSPVAKMATVRVLIAVVVSLNWELHHMDVHNAFLHGDLDEEVYMQFPPRYGTPTPGKVCRLRKSLYGLRQAPKQWFSKLSSALRGIKVARSLEGIFLSQRKYALDILTKAGMLDCKPIDTPMDQNHCLAHASGEPFAQPERYRRFVSHWDAAIRVLRYLMGSSGQGILLRPTTDLRLTAFCDSEWAACPLSWRSLSGYFVFLGRSPVSWKTKK